MVGGFHVGPGYDLMNTTQYQIGPLQNPCGWSATGITEVCQSMTTCIENELKQFDINKINLKSIWSIKDIGNNRNKQLWSLSAYQRGFRFKSVEMYDNRSNIRV